MSWFSNWTSGSSSSCPGQRVVTRTVTTYGPGGTQVTTYQGNNQCPVSVPQTYQPSVAVQSIPADDVSADQFELDALDEHNKLRALHGCPPLKLNRNLCNFAKEWAKYLAGRNTLQHRSNNKYGENLYMSSGMEVNGRTAVRSWYDEIKYYSFRNGGFSSQTGHFTQVVWKGSRELGVAFMKSGNSTYVVANYDPPGNYTGQFQQNVPPPQ